MINNYKNKGEPEITVNPPQKFHYLETIFTFPLTLFGETKPLQ